MSGKVYVLKLVAAERQLREAIRMFFEQRDELAIHTVASAAYRILRDMKENRGINEAADTQFRGIFRKTDWVGFGSNLEYIVSYFTGKSRYIYTFFR